MSYLHQARLVVSVCVDALEPLTEDRLWDDVDAAILAHELIDEVAGLVLVHQTGAVGAILLPELAD